MTWGATDPPVNSLYTTACKKVENLARREQPWREIATCRSCGCSFLPKLRGLVECASCYQRGGRETEEQVERDLYRRYVELEGTSLQRRAGLPIAVKVDPPLPSDDDAPAQGTLFQDVA